MKDLTENQRLQLKLVSELLHYPDEQFVKRLPGLAAVVGKLADKDSRKRLEQFIGTVRSSTRIELQETYTTLFDMNPSTTLNVTYHLWGDGEKRADALARLKALYGRAGYELSTGELPDYLPLMLEFLALRPDAPGVEVLWRCLGGLRELLDRLERVAPNYGSLLEVLAGIVSNAIGEDLSRPAAGFAGQGAAVESASERA